MNNNLSEINKQVNAASWNFKIEVLRILRGWSMKETAERLGVHSRIYENWAHATYKPNRCNQDRLANLFGVPQSDIFGDEMRSA